MKPSAEPVSPRRCHRRAMAGWMLLAGSALVSCAPHPPERPSPVASAEPFSHSGTRPAPDRWWTEFDDPKLTALIERALGFELGLKATWQQLRRARAVVARESATLFPQVEGSVDGGISAGDGGGGFDFGGDGFGGGGGFGGFGGGGGDGDDGGTEGRIELGLSADYEVDLWGRIRATIDAERFRAEATREDYRAAAITLSSEVALAWLQLLEAEARRDLLRQQVAANEKLLRQLRNQFAGGQTRSVDVLRQRQLVAATRQQIHAAEATIGVRENRLAVLVGEPPQDGIAYSAQPLPSLPPLPDTGVPATLVRRRPDVRAAVDRLGAADRDVAAAVSDQYPRLTLSASLGTEGGSGAEELFDNWARSFAANLVAPLLDAGRRRAEVYRTAALETQRLYEYGQTVLVAFREVENALVREREQRQQLRELREQVDLAGKTYEQLLVEYANGVGDFIDLITALTDQQQLRRDLLAARRELLEIRVSLYRALAGGFETPASAAVRPVSHSPRPPDTEPDADS